MDQPDFEQLRRKLAELKSEHRDLDDVISHLAETRPFDQLQLQRLKKRKLSLKDQILKLEDALLPDIIA
ncbi:MAG: YdcH family protein [Kiloniellaceae bacterium]